MKRKLLKIYLTKIKVNKNGDLAIASHVSTTPENDEEKNNAVIATLVYPRSGAATVVSTKYLELKNNVELSWDTSDFWKNGLFKEEVQDETILKIMVADRDKISKFSRFILTLTKTLIGAGFGAVTGGITNVLLGAAVNLALNEYKESLNIDKDEHIDIIGVAETKIDLNTPQNTVTMNLKAPKLIEKSYYKIQSPPLTGVDRVTETILRKGEDNGIIELQISYADM